MCEVLDRAENRGIAIGEKRRHKLPEAVNDRIWYWQCSRVAAPCNEESCRAAHTAVFPICEMVSTNFKHINANYNLLYKTKSIDTKRCWEYPHRRCTS